MVDIRLESNTICAARHALSKIWFSFEGNNVGAAFCKVTNKPQKIHNDIAVSSRSFAAWPQPSEHCICWNVHVFYELQPPTPAFPLSTSFGKLGKLCFYVFASLCTACRTFWVWCCRFFCVLSCGTEWRLPPLAPFIKTSGDTPVYLKSFETLASAASFWRLCSPMCNDGMQAVVIV